MPVDPAANPVGRANQRLEASRHLLGVLPDGDVAVQLGVARKTIVAYRKKHGIPRYRQTARLSPEAVNPHPVGTGRASRLDTFLDIIGTLSDREVAERAGMTTENVRMYRQRRGIAASWRGEASTPTVSTNPGRGAGLAYRLTIGRDQERSRFVVVATDPLDAIRRATATVEAQHPGFTIRSLKLVAPMMSESSAAE